MTEDSDHQQLVHDAKAIIALAFRNGPTEDLHVGKLCSTCDGRSGYSQITDAEMKTSHS